MEQNSLTIYRVKHIPTGMYYIRKGLSETKGRIYKGENSIITQCAHTKIYIQIIDKEVIKKYKDVFEKCGEVISRNKKGEICVWRYLCKPEDFKIEPLVTIYNI